MKIVRNTMTDYTNINKTITNIKNTMNYYTTVTQLLKISRNTMKYYIYKYKTIENITKYNETLHKY